MFFTRIEFNGVSTPEIEDAGPCLGMCQDRWTWRGGSLSLPPNQPAQVERSSLHPCLSRQACTGINGLKFGIEDDVFCLDTKGEPQALVVKRASKRLIFQNTFP